MLYMDWTKIIREITTQFEMGSALFTYFLTLSYLLSLWMGFFVMSSPLELYSTNSALLWISVDWPQ